MIKERAVYMGIAYHCSWVEKDFSVACSVNVSARVCWEWEQNNLIELAQSFANKLTQ